MDLIVDFPEQQPKQSVAFAEESYLVIIESYIGRYDLWYTGEEMQLFKWKIARKLQLIKSVGLTVAQYAELNIENTSSFLGLETYLTETGPQEVVERRRASKRAVLLEQTRQTRLGLNDPEAMARISERLSELSRMRSRIIGQLQTARIMGQKHKVINALGDISR